MNLRALRVSAVLLALNLVAAVAALVAVAAGGGTPAASAQTHRMQHRTHLPYRLTRRAYRSTLSPGEIPALPGGPAGPAHPQFRRPAVAAPVRVRIPSIGVDSALQRLRVLPDGTLQQPSRWQVAGWYAGGVRPGEVGPAVIAGHVDSIDGPAVFYRLRDLTDGASVYISERDGTRLHFLVAHSEAFPKRSFPTRAVYGPTAVPTLRLVTCTGAFDYARASYVDNLVVTAYLAGQRGAGGT